MLVSEKAKKAKFCKAAESYGVCHNGIKPVLGYGMVDMTIRGKRDPNIDVRQVDHRNQIAQGPARQGGRSEVKEALRALLGLEDAHFLPLVPVQELAQ